MMLIYQPKSAVRNCTAHRKVLAAMSAMPVSFSFLPIEDSRCASNLQSHTHSVTSRNWFDSLSFATATRGLSTGGHEYHKRLLSVRAKAEGHGGPDREGLQIQQMPQNETVDTAADVNTANQGKGSSSVLSFLCPLLKFIGGVDPSLPRNDIFEVISTAIDGGRFELLQGCELLGGKIVGVSHIPFSTLFTGWVPTIVRTGRGMTLWEKAKPELAAEKLELFSYENSQYARIVREALCELELPYILHNAGKGSSKIKTLLQIAGSDKVPYLIDPNTGVCLDNHKEIISYLFQTYCNTL